MQLRNDATPGTSTLPGTDSMGSVAAGFLGYLGTRRWALMLPELHFNAAYLEGVDGTIIVDETPISFESGTRSIETLAVMFGGQVAVVRSGRVWIRGGIGSGRISSRIEDEDQGVGIDLPSATGLALSGAAGVSLWIRTFRAGGPTMSVDAEVHYLSIRSDELHVASPSVRVGWRVMAAP
jgi:hypothetical protein